METSCKVKRRHLLCYLATLTCFFFSGCSGLIKEMKSIPVTDGSTWVEKIKPCDTDPYVNKVAQYHNGTILITMLYPYRTDSCLISGGPPMFPIIPLFLGCFSLKNRGSLTLYFVVENLGDTLSIDVNGMKLLKSKGINVTPDSKYYCTVIDRYCFKCDSRGILQYPVPDAPVVMSKGTKMIFSLFFRHIDSIGELKLEFGDVFVAGGNTSLPSIIFRGAHNYLYCPCEVTGHEPRFLMNE